MHKGLQYSQKYSDVRNLVTVGVGGEFPTVTRALGSISASSTSRFTIQVIGRITDNVTIPSNVDIVGLGAYASQIVSGTNATAVITTGTSATNCSINNLGLVAGTGATDFASNVSVSGGAILDIRDCVLTAQYTYTSQADDGGRAFFTSGSDALLRAYNCRIDGVQVGAWNNSFNPSANTVTVQYLYSCLFDRIGSMIIHNASDGRMQAHDCSFGSYNDGAWASPNSLAVVLRGTSGTCGDVFLTHTRRLQLSSDVPRILNVQVGVSSSTARYFSFNDETMAEITLQSSNASAYVMDEYEFMSGAGNPTLPVAIYSDIAGSGSETESGLYRLANKDDASTMPAEAIWVFTVSGGATQSTGYFARRGLMYLGNPSGSGVQESGNIYVGASGVLVWSKPRAGIIQKLGRQRQGAAGILQIELEQVELDKYRFTWDSAGTPAQSQVALINTARFAGIIQPAGTGNEINPRVILANGLVERLPANALKNGASTTSSRAAAQATDGTTFTFLNSTSPTVRWYFGHGKPFAGIDVDLTIAGSYGALTWEYWNGSSWATLTETIGYGFAADGTTRWDEPANWVAKVLATSDETEWGAGVPTVVANIRLYWIRIGAAAVTTNPTIDRMSARGKAVIAKPGDVTEVLVDTSDVAPGDILVTSSITAGRAMTNNAQTDAKRILGVALEAKTGGANGVVLAEVLA
ncbi:hypothetical protein HYS94_01525 [Candidatus Daviesbacteria bacterium]|nr:hypothetical protein [Candidatus Daviesbacteria bacterium]